MLQISTQIYTQICLRQVSSDLLTQVHQLDLDCLGGFWSHAAYAKELENPRSCLLALVNSDTQVLGFGCLWSILEEAHITILVVHPNYRRLGLGRYLVWGLLQWASDRQLEWATLEVRASNIAAIALYQTFDFMEIGRRQAYYQAPTEDAVIMWRKGLHLAAFAQDLSTYQQTISQSLDTQGWQILP
jgi:[ribosomal protein S18]-alanine N-acetyltransferase